MTALEWWIAGGVGWWASVSLAYAVGRANSLIRAHRCYVAHKERWGIEERRAALRMWEAVDVLSGRDDRSYSPARYKEGGSGR
jgi:hypothetical protein